METQTPIESPVRHLLTSVNKIIIQQAENLSLIAEGKEVIIPIPNKDWEMVLKIIDKMPNFTQFEKIANGEVIAPTGKLIEHEPETVPEATTERVNPFEARSKVIKAKLNGETNKD